MPQIIDKDLRSGSLGMYRSNTDKPIMGRSYGRPGGTARVLGTKACDFD